MVYIVASVLNCQRHNFGLAKSRVIKLLPHSHMPLEVYVISKEVAILMFGLSKERPTLGDNPKAHIHEIRRISCEIKRHSLPTALHKTEEFLLSYLIVYRRET